MKATSFRRGKWSAFSLPAFFVLALYAQNPAQTIRGGNGVTLLRLRRPRPTRSAMSITARGSWIPTAGWRMGRARRRGPG